MGQRPAIQTQIRHCIIWCLIGSAPIPYYIAKYEMVKKKNTNVPQLMRLRNSIRHIWVKITHARTHAGGYDLKMPESPFNHKTQEHMQTKTVYFTNLNKIIIISILERHERTLSNAVQTKAFIQP